MSSSSESDTANSPTPIKHLCLSGGGIYGLSIYGALKEAHKMGIWNLENIKSIYGCSAGTIVAVLISLNCEWDDIDNYLINRPWRKLFDKEFNKINATNIMATLLNKGLYDKTIFTEFFNPFFSAKEVSLDITLREFHEYNHIELHFFATDLNSAKLVDLSYKTYPDMKLIDAVYCSCSIPLVFSPTITENDKECFIDPIIHLNYPIEYCLKEVKNSDEVLGIRKRICKYLDNGGANSPPVTSSTNFIEYVSKIMTVMVAQQRLRHYPDIKNQIIIDIPNSSTLTDIYDSIAGVNNKEFREELIELGSKTCRKTYESSSPSSI